MIDALIVILRYVLAVAFAKMATRGWISTDDVATLLGPSVTIVIGVTGWLATVAWALYRSRFKAKVQDVLASPDVSTIHASPALTQSLQVPGVVPTPPAAP